MSENRCNCGTAGASSGTRETVCIDTYRILDSCRDRDCYENARVYLSEAGQELIDRCASGVRVICAKILWTHIDVDEIQFNRGFYQLNTRFYIHIRLETCVCGRPQEFCGIAVLDKNVILYGGEGKSNVFRSTGDCNRCRPWTSTRDSNMPIGVVEAVEPVVLGTRVLEPCDGCNCGCPCYCPCGVDEIPCELLEDLGLGTLVDRPGGNRLYVSIGLFTVYRIERPAQLVVSAADFCVPDKECVSAEPCNPCSLFRTMAFPTGEFCSTSAPTCGDDRKGRGNHS